MPSSRICFLTLITMIAFAGNSVLCRIALKHTGIDAASFTSIRLVSGAVVLWAIASLHRGNNTGRGNWISAFALFAYAAGFSFAYISLTAATGAMLLFGAVRATMIGHGLWVGERLNKQQLVGLMLASGGLIGLLLPGLSAPPLVGSVLMLIAGIAWGIYSLRGKGAGNPIRIRDQSPFSGTSWSEDMKRLVTPSDSSNPVTMSLNSENSIRIVSVFASAG